MTDTIRIRNFNTDPSAIVSVTAYHHGDAFYWFACRADKVGENLAENPLWGMGEWEVEIHELG